MDIREKIEEIAGKPVKDREEWEHQLILKVKFFGSVRDYLLSMGPFKEDDE